MSATKPPKGFAPQEDVLPLYEEKLASSGLDRSDGIALGYRALSAEEIAAMHHWSWNPVPALYIPYFDPYTGQPMKFLSNWPDFYRVRWLREPLSIPGDKRKVPKYTQQSDSGICAYFPRIGGVDWKSVLKDHNQSLVLTEGELKAAAACKAGVPTIGLGGVYNFMSKGYGYNFVPSLENIVWARRVVTVCYDSDASSNPKIITAINKISDQLAERGALMKVLILPASGNTKIGIDDYLLDHTVDNFKILLNEQSQYITMVRALFDINAKWSYVRKFYGVVLRSNGDAAKTTDFVTSFTANAEELKVKSDGEITSSMVPAGKRWLEWPLRSEVDDVTYDPARPPLEEFYDDERQITYFNTWNGWGKKKNLQPVCGNIEPFLDLMKYLFQGATSGAMEWFIQWLGYPIKHPGVKLRTSAIIHGTGERIGKSSIGYTMAEIYGENFQEVLMDQLTGQFNTWQIRKQFIMCDDITGDNKFSTIDRIKNMISRPTVFVNEKNKPNYNLPDKANFLWTSNRPAAFALSDHDSRFFVHRVEVKKPRLETEWDVYYNWLRDESGTEALFYYFINDVDYTGFYPNGSAFATAAKEDMKEASQSLIGVFIRDLLRDGPEETFSNLDVGGIPNVKGRDMFTADEILMCFRLRYPEEPPLKSRAISNTLLEVCESAGQIRAHGANRRYCIIRNLEKWKTATLKEKITHIENPLVIEKKVTPPKKKKT